jgi:hypothetical protein
MKLDGTLGDGQSQPDATGFAIARVIHAVKRSIDFVKRGRGNARAMVTNRYENSLLSSRG